MIGPGARVAVYYAPRPDDPLAIAAAAWLGRDPARRMPADDTALAERSALPMPAMPPDDAPGPQPDLPDIAAITAEPRLYGFHATLKPPMRLAAGCRWSDVQHAAAELADRTAPFALPALAVADVSGFLALRETLPCPPLQALADACVAQLDRFRAPPSDDELARRRRSGLTPPQDAMLVRWGYPYVFATWFFHLTLTRRLTPSEKALYQPAAERYFAAAIAVPRLVDDICLFVQPAPGAPFSIAERLPLRG